MRHIHAHTHLYPTYLLCIGFLCTVMLPNLSPSPCCHLTLTRTSIITLCWLHAPASHTHTHTYLQRNYLNLHPVASQRIATHALNLLFTLICYVRSPPSADRFRADDMLQDSREDCYLSTLHILHTDEHDSRPYYLVVENERGTDRHAIHLNVEGTFTGAE